jgi:hypothetical protein
VSAICGRSSHVKRRYRHSAHPGLQIAISCASVLMGLKARCAPMLGESGFSARPCLNADTAGATRDIGQPTGRPDKRKRRKAHRPSSFFLLRHGRSWLNAGPCPLSKNFSRYADEIIKGAANGAPSVS